MLSKLTKYEFKSILRILIPISMAFVAMTGVTFVVTSFSYDNGLLKVIPGIITLLYTINLIMLIAASYLFTIYRFYKNLITSEGYLMFTLPVSAGTLIKSKLITAITTQITSAVLCILSLLTLSKAKHSLFGFSSFRLAMDELVTILHIDGPVLITIMMIFILLCLLLNNLTFYASIALGHTVSKNKIIGSVLCYFIINTIPQTFATIIMIVVGFWVNPSSIVSILFSIIGLFLVIGSILLYYLTRYYLSKKLNLE